MMRWGSIAGAALAGLAAFLFLFPRVDTGARDWKMGIGREGARAIAVDLARENGLDIRAWRFSVNASLASRLLELRRRYSVPALTAFTPLSLQILALSPQGAQTVKVDLFADGRLSGYAQTGALAQPGGEAPEQVAERAFKRLAGSDAGQYKEISRAAASGAGSAIWTWERQDDGLRGFVSRIKVEVAQGRVVSASIEPDIAPELLRFFVERRRQGAVYLSSGFVLVAFPVISVAAWVFFSRLGRRRRHARLAARLALCFAVLFALGYLTGNRLDAIVASAAGVNQAFTTILLGSLFGPVTLVILWMVLFGAGFALVPLEQRRLWLGAWLIARGKWRDRRVGQELFAGLLLGLPLACIPYILPFFDRSGALSTDVIEPGRLVARAPWTASLGNLSLSFDALALVAFLLPVTSRYIPRRRLARLAMVVPAVLFTAAWRDHYYSALGPAFIEAGLLVASYLLIARAAGLAGLAAAMISSFAVPQGALFLLQPAPELSQLGLGTFLRLGAAALAAAALAWFGRPSDEPAILEALDPDREDLQRTDQERLLGEFAVARRAQEGMLPQHPPAIPGFELDAICRPALEVGGDLYDFHTLPDGRCLFCVADVSGKGVPASLYMTLTKGLLTALARHLHAADEIVVEMNRHIFAEGRRRTFVTLVLGVLDPRTGSVDIVRAGHNPPLFHRARTGETRFLQPKGLGLGLIGSGSFRTHLAVQTLKLEPEDCLLFYSDGLPETMDPRQQQFTEERLRRVLATHHGSAPQDLRQTILAAVDQFRSTADAHDDLTLLIVRALRN
jgi:serine phosphatase RsbU (regulator of sigma subunit)